jgi:hypothetical protein
MKLHDLVPDADTLLALEPEELAGILLEHLHRIAPQARGQFHQSSVLLGHSVAEYPERKREALTGALIEAWRWLEREGLLVPKSGDNNSWMVLSRPRKEQRSFLAEHQRVDRSDGAPSAEVP